jgi:hypothetical protein
LFRQCLLVVVVVALARLLLRPRRLLLTHLWLSVLPRGASLLLAAMHQLAAMRFRSDIVAESVWR